MNITTVLVLFAVIIPAASYAWGMRGTTIGGEKGAMLPGAIIGTLLALCSNIFIVQEHFYIFAALGAIAMYFGGCMTYGETLSFSMSAYPATDLRKGLGALALKGFLWFSVFGTVFTTGVCAVTQKYNLIELLLIFILTPALALIGLHLFNRPLIAHDVIFPKFYFSKTRKEYWGAMVGILTSLLLINIIKLNLYSIIFTLICGVFGAIGWVTGQLLQIYFIHKAKKSSLKLIRLCAEKGFFDSWKAMECTLGAVGGLGCAVAFVVTYKDFKASMLYLELNGGLVAKSSELLTVFLIIWFILLAIDMLHYYIKKPLSVAQLKELYTDGKISEDRYVKKMFKATAQARLSSKLASALEAYEFIVYAAIPFILIALGSKHTAQTMAFFMLYWVLAQEIGFEEKLYKIPLTIFGIIFLILQFPLSMQFSVKSTLLLYTVIYEVLSFVFITKQILSSKVKAIQLKKSSQLIEEIKYVLKNKSFIVTHTYFVICIVLIFIIL